MSRDLGKRAYETVAKRFGGEAWLSWDRLSPEQKVKWGEVASALVRTAVECPDRWIIRQREGPPVVVFEKE